MLKHTCMQCVNMCVCVDKGGWMGREGICVHVCVCVCVCVGDMLKLLCIQCMCVQITACYMY